MDKHKHHAKLLFRLANHTWRATKLASVVSVLPDTLSPAASFSLLHLQFPNQKTARPDVWRNEQGFIPMIICIILILAGVIYFAYTRVAAH